MIGLQDTRTVIDEDFERACRAYGMWAKSHTCADCRRWQPCPCGCGWGMCAEDPYRTYYEPEDTVSDIGCEEAEAW